MHTSVSVPDTDLLVTQDWAAYSPEDHDLWRILHERRMKDLERIPSIL